MPDLLASGYRWLRKRAPHVALVIAIVLASLTALDWILHSTETLRKVAVFLGVAKDSNDESKFVFAKTQHSLLRDAVVRELSIPVIYEHQQAKAWNDEWTSDQKITITREMGGSGDPCRFEYIEASTKEAYFDRRPLGPAIKLGTETFQVTDPKKEQQLKLINTSIERAQYAINIGEIKSISIANYSLASEDVLYKLGAIPNRDRILGSGGPLFMIITEVSGKRISKSTTVAKQADQAPGLSETELLETSTFFVSSQSVARKMVKDIRDLAISCGACARRSMATRVSG